MMREEALLKVEHLCQKFGKADAVKDVSFEVRKGEVFGLVGESGCGKTTTGRCVMGLYPITSGEIFFEGRAIGKRKKAEKAIQMIFQDPLASLDPRMTVKEIIAEGLIVGGAKNKEEIEQKVLSVLDMVGLQRQYVGRYPHEFSGGQRQRIGIARAIIMEPKLLIADEPLSALDVSIQAQIINLLNDLRKKLGLTILFVAHDLAVVKYFSDRIAVMRSGRILELAPSEELFEHPLHPYTRSLLSAIPIPDPRRERKRVRIAYVPLPEDEGRRLRQVGQEHFVYCNEEEYGNYLKMIQ